MNNLPSNPLTPIIGQPTAFTIRKLKRELIAHARSIPSDHGCHGHLILVLSPEEFTALTNGAVFHEPVHPGHPPVADRDATNAPIHTVDCTEYYRKWDEYCAFVDVQSGLRKLLLAAVEEPYYSVLKDRLFGYADVTPRDLLAHLEAKYGTIHASDLVKNRLILQAPWNPDDPITTLWSRARSCQEFACNSIEPLADEMIIHYVLEALAASGVMAPYINEWRRFAPITQTWAKFTQHFERADKVDARKS